jgi:hypothetical protein
MRLLVLIIMPLGNQQNCEPHAESKRDYGRAFPFLLLPHFTRLCYTFSHYARTNKIITQASYDGKR